LVDELWTLGRPDVALAEDLIFRDGSRLPWAPSRGLRLALSSHGTTQESR
jgi:hypothetical protein